MLVLTQLSVGAFCTATILRLFFPSGFLRELTPFHSLVALLLGFLAFGASTVHLGRPPRRGAFCWARNLVAEP